ncbi:AraC family transcriptional regulator [Paenibacillus dokdonensis]|uniref:AraC family transcriptional regulator n=1 Tax=Paenibacillus dokdonensis TaxID=2567944 RepID=UPI0014579D89|nr:AraC family transcriptional regulator [Paenibacillus dokdonensis]
MEWLLHARFRLTEAVVMMHEHMAGYHLLFSESPSYILIASANRHGSIVIDGILSALTPEKVNIVHPGQRVEINCPSIGEQTLYMLCFEITVSEEVNADPDISRLTMELGVVSSAENLLYLCKKVAEHWHTNDIVDRFASQAGFQDLLHLLLKRQGQHADALDQVRQYIKRHYPSALTVDDLARMAGMSRYYFMRSFKEKYDQSAMDYLTEIRMNHAKQFMEEDGSTLREIAEKIGYKDPQYFSSQFNKHTGISPSMYIANRKNKIAAYSWPNIGHLLTLQIIPYAAPIDQFWSDEYRRKYRFDVKVPLSHDYDFNREALWRARPDMIIALEEMIPDEEKEKLRQIAPVLFLPWHGENWRVHLQMTARFLDREIEGEKWLARYEKKVENVRKLVPHSFKHGSLLILNFSSIGIKIWGRRAGTVLYDDLQIASGEGVEQIEYTEFVTAEQLETFDADVLLIHVMKDHQSQTLWLQLQESETWTKLKAVRNQQIYHTSSPAWISEPILEYTANRHEYLLQELYQLFSAL